MAWTEQRSGVRGQRSSVNIWMTLNSFASLNCTISSFSTAAQAKRSQSQFWPMDYYGMFTLALTIASVVFDSFIFLDWKCTKQLRHSHIMSHCYSYWAPHQHRANGSTSSNNYSKRISFHVNYLKFQKNSQNSQNERCVGEACHPRVGPKWEKALARCRTLLLWYDRSNKKYLKYFWTQNKRPLLM